MNEMIQFNESGITVDTTEVENMLREYPNLIAYAFERLAYFLSAELIKEAPVGTNEQGRQAGTFRRGITLPRQGGPLTWIVGLPGPLAIYINEGTRPHKIRSKNKKALSFPWPGRGLGGYAMPYLKSVGITPRIKMGGMRTRTYTGRSTFKGKKFSWKEYKSGDESVFKSVHHPGSKIPARPYLVIIDEEKIKGVAFIAKSMQMAVDRAAVGSTMAGMQGSGF